jgi:serine/threonine protein kinase
MADGTQQQASPTALGGFKLVRKLGQGAMGVVFLARQVSVERDVALKVLPQRLARNKDFVQRFFREARAAAQLDHANIVQAIDAGEASGYHYFAMEFVDGHNLRQILDRDGALPEKQALGIASQIAQALHYAHTTANIIHRDIKPENILLAPDGTPKLTDMGLAREVVREDSSLTQAGEALGTPNYISPEQIRGETDLDGRTDVYALGATLFHLVTGQTPYSGRTRSEVMSKHLTDPIPDPRSINPRVSAGTAGVIRKAMAKDKRQRYAGAQAMAADIEAAREGRAAVGAPVAAVAPRKPQPGRSVRRRRTRRRSPWPAVMAFVLAAVVATGAAVVFMSEDDTDPVPSDSLVSDGHGADPRGGPVQPDGLTDGSGDVVSEAEPGAEVEPDPEAERRRVADLAFARLMAEAAEHTQQSDYDAALALFSNIPETYADLLATRVTKAVADIRAEAEGLIDPVLAEADRLSKAGEPRKGLAELDKLEGMKYQPLAAKIASLRGRLTAEATKLDEEKERQALAAAKPTAKELLAENLKLYKVYLAKCDELKKQEYAALTKEYGSKWSKLKDDIASLEKEIGDLEEAARRARAAAKRTPKRDWPKRRWPRRGGRDRRRFSFAPPENPLETLRPKLIDLNKKKSAMAAAVKKEKARIASRYQKRKERVRLIYLRHREALVRGDELTREKITANYKIALKVK